MHDNGVYAIEDLHTMAMWRGDPIRAVVDGKDVYGFLAEWSRGMVGYFHPNEKIDPFVAHMSSISTYDSMAFVHYQNSWSPINSFRRGQNFIPNNDSPDWKPLLKQVS